MLPGGFAVDSGSPFSFLIQPAYRILKQELIQYFQERDGLRPCNHEEGHMTFAMVCVTPGRN